MFQSQFLTVNNRNLHYLVGPPNGPPLVLLHGVLRNHKSFTPILTQLSSRWQIYLPDFRGHGDSDPVEDSYRIIDYAEDATALLETTIQEKAIVYGHSLGAMVAAKVASDLPNRVSAAILEDPPFDTMGCRIPENHFYQFFTGVKKVLTSNRTTEEIACALSAMPVSTPDGTETQLGAVRDKTSIRFSASCLSQVDPDVLNPIVDVKWMEGYETESVLKQIACPTLLLQADYNSGGMMLDEDACQIASQIQNCIHIKLENTGHLLHTNETDSLLYHVLNFLGSL